MKKSSPGSTYAVIILLVIAGAFVYSWRLILPKYKANKAAIAQAETDIGLAQTKLESLKTAQSSLAELGDIVNKLLVAIPEDEDAPNLITELEAIATKHQTVIPNIQVSDAAAALAASASSAPAAATAGNSVLITLSVNGTVENLNQFLNSIEHDIRFMKIASYTFSVSEDEASLALSINAFRRPALAASTTAVNEAVPAS